MHEFFELNLEEKLVQKNLVMHNLMEEEEESKLIGGREFHKQSRRSSSRLSRGAHFEVE